MRKIFAELMEGVAAMQDQRAGCDTVTPDDFWSFYKQEVKDRGSWSQYQKTSSWTKIAKSAAESACHRFGFATAREYFNIDVIAWTGKWNDREYDYDVRIAFEVEDSLLWEDELCKLAHIVADLRVLVAYQSHLKRNAEDVLDERLARHKNRVVRDCNCKWLFIFGPHPRNRTGPWKAYSLDEHGCRISLTEDQPLCGFHMSD